MNFEELKAEVLSIVKRPDLDSQIESAVKAATLKAHQSDFFFNDILEVSVQFSEARHIQVFSPKDVVPKYRQAKYIRLWEGDHITGGPGKFLEHIQIAAAMDDYGYARQDVFYMAGANLQIRSSTPVGKILFGSYVHPTITPASELNSWIAREYPWAIIYEACRAIFMSVGFQEQARNMQALVMEQFSSLSMSNVDEIPT